MNKDYCNHEHAQEVRSFTEPGWTSDHLSRPYVPQEPAKMTYSAPYEVTSRSPPCSIEQPRESDEGQW